jgi:oxygen-independent coproporphyrinogen-3 oxidase
MAFGIYVHIPYCIQRCSYCDFATYEQSQILPPIEYIQLILKEIRLYGHLLRDRTINTLYFGGGTPSLIEPIFFKKIVEELKFQGFGFSDDVEITIEINPATVSTRKMEEYLSLGINRFSVGAQTFDDSTLKTIGREHNSRDTLETLSLLKSKMVNFSFDILFALPGQTLKALDKDLERVFEIEPNHVSPYCLTVQDRHPFAKSRLDDTVQVQMFELIRRRLIEFGMEQYEISNFAKPGFESRHNMLYWTDQEYWGIGLSSHSYTRTNIWGERFWNPSNIGDYQLEIESKVGHFGNILDGRKNENFELIKVHQSLTDYCHTFLRTMRGLSRSELEIKFGAERAQLVENNIEILYKQDLIKKEIDNWKLTERGILLSNQVFATLTFLKEDLL